MITFFVVTDTYDPTIAGTLGDLIEANQSKIDHCWYCRITTDDYDALAARLREDDNVISYTVIEDKDI